ncbi:MAG TPA: hypothetical protein VMJ93_17770 [Verrucomicrobiae bacterium]|nr:hypothetical protein [Verrucomicrobiae bacterium]
MKQLMILAAALALFGMSAGAQSQPGVQASGSTNSNADVSANRAGAQAANNSSAAASAEAGKNSATLASGATMQAELTHPVDAKKSRPGDTVTAKTTSAAESNGQVVIPKGSTLVGHVTEAREHEKKSKDRPEEPSVVGIAWDKAVLKDGQVLPLNAEIQALASTQSEATSTIADDEMPVDSGAMGGGYAGERGGVGGMGAMGGVADGAAGGLRQPIGGVGTAANGALNAAGGAAGSTRVVGNSTESLGAVGGLNSSGRFVPNSRGVFGLRGVNLAQSVSGEAEASVISSSTENVRLDKGTRLLLALEGQSQAGAHASSEPKEAGKSSDSGGRGGQR